MGYSYAASLGARCKCEENLKVLVVEPLATRLTAETAAGHLCTLVPTALPDATAGAVRQALLDTTHVRKFVSATGRPTVTARLPRLCDADRSVIGGVDKVTCLGASLVSHQTGLCDEAACGGEAPRFWASSSREEHCRTG